MKGKKHLLVVDDSPVNRKILFKILSGSYTVMEAENGQTALELLEKYPGIINCVILDVVMPVMDGLDFLRAIGEREQFRNLPILVATSDQEASREKECLQLGAWDFVRKPYDPGILRLRLENIISRSQMTTFDQVRHVAEHDALTGLYNRARFFAATRELLDTHPNEQFFFVRFDIDRFRLINSFFGEKEGDKLLQYIADCIRQDAAFISYCTYGRIESDVFCLCIPNHEGVLHQMVEKVRSLLANYNPSYFIEPSFGVALITDTSLPVETIFAHASMAAERCKNKYMTYLAYYDQSMTETIVQEQEIMNEAQSALDQEQFVVYLQPKYNLVTSTPCGAEALVRWKHPRWGLVPPGKFIPVFERNGFIGPLDEYMWDHTCHLLRKWTDEGLNPAPVSVNISRANMYNPHLVEILNGLIHKYDIPASLLNLELTETAYMDNPDLMKKTVAMLQKEGFLVMMDDFGSGYSSLNTLKDITVDILKVDMKFLPSGHSNGRSERILASIIRMAGWLSLPVVVEGVETAAQKDFLESVGCGYVQGYYFARPMPVEDYEALIRRPDLAQTPDAPPLPEDAGTIEAVWSSDPGVCKTLDSILEPVAVYEFADGAFTPLRTNRAYRDTFGADPAYPGQSRPSLEQVSQEDYARVGETFRGVASSGGSASCDYCRKFEAGRTRRFRMKLQYIQSIPGGGIFLAVFSDLTA